MRTRPWQSTIWLLGWLSVPVGTTWLDNAGPNDDVHRRPHPARIKNGGVAPHEISDLRHDVPASVGDCPIETWQARPRTAAAGRQRPQPPVR